MTPRSRRLTCRCGCPVIVTTDPHLIELFQLRHQPCQETTP